MACWGHPLFLEGNMAVEKTYRASLMADCLQTPIARLVNCCPRAPAWISTSILEFC